jgi:methylase of polypeptide subunit release factors
VLDTNDAAVAGVMENAERNGVRDRFVHLPIGQTIFPLPPEQKVDVVISNPIQVAITEPREREQRLAPKTSLRCQKETLRVLPAGLHFIHGKPPGG